MSWNPGKLELSIRFSSRLWPFDLALLIIQNIKNIIIADPPTVTPHIMAIIAVVLRPFLGGVVGVGDGNGIEVEDALSDSNS